MENNRTNYTKIKQKKQLQKTMNLMNKIILLLFILPVILASNKSLCSIHCQICSDPATCIKCKQLYVIAPNGQCFRDGVVGPGVQGCVAYDTVGDVRHCAKCKEDRMLVKGKCIKFGKNCQLIDQFYECIKCSPGHQLVGRQCLSTKINNCPLGQIPYKKYCRPYSQMGCLQKNQQSCTKCLKNYNLIHGLCIQKSFKIILSTSSCKTVIPPNFCLAQSPIPHCLVSTSLFCQSCEPGYSLQKGQCLKSVKQDDPNCNVYDSKTQVCTGCNNDYQLDRNSLCVRNFPIQTCYFSMFFQSYQGNCFYKDRFCQRIQVNTHICVACMEGYVLRAGKCERQYKCAKFYNGLCEQCMPEFFLQPCSRSCSQKPRNCIRINRQNDQCIQCTPPTQLSSLTLTRRPTCVRLQQKCIEYNNEGSCISCMSGFVQKNRKCYPKPANCQQLSQSDSTLCIKCQSRYKMIDSQCFEHIQGCIKYSRNGSCFACASRFVKYNGQCIFVDSMCLTYDQDGMCVGCRDGLLPVANKCVFYQAFCQSYAEDRVCNSSYDKWFNISYQILSEETKNSYKQFVISSSKVQSPFSQRPQVTQRQISDNKGYYSKYGIITFPPTLTLTKSSIKLLKSTLEIISCKQGFYLFSPSPQHSSCIPVEKWSQFCKSYNPSTFDCVLCQKGYDMNSDGKCEIRSGKSCGDRIINKENCGRCNVRNGYYNVGGWCLHRGIERSGNTYIELVDLKVRWPLMANCLIQTGMNQCEQCALGYTKVQGRCVTYQKYCEVYHALGFCFKCRAGYMKYGQNCIPLNCPKSYSRCSNCLNPYTYRSGHCILQKLPNCLIPSSQLISQCLLCQPQFYLSSSLSSPSSIRSSIRRSSCLPSSRNCALMNQSKKQCLYCYENYLLWNGQCIKQISYCVEYGGEGRCLRCQNDKLLVQNSTGSRCFGLPDHCAQINNLGRCTSCEPSYTLFQQECVIYQKNCKKYDKTGRCLSCIQPFLLQNGQCTTQSVCIFPPSAKPSQCKKCRAPLHQIDGYCIEKDDNCKQYKNGKCVACLNLFHMMEQKCVANPKHCLLFNSQADKCVNCESGFIVIDGVCQDINVRFFACKDIKGDTCVQCEYGYKLTNNTCTPTTCLTQTPTRSCLTCPPYYKKHLTSSSTICIPHFCQSSSFQKFINSTLSPINLNNCPFVNAYQGGLHCHASGRISIQYCIKYDQQSLKCTMCEAGWGVRESDQFGVCIVNGCLKEEVRCRGCKDGYELMEDSTCNIKYCMIFNQQTHTCTSCQPSHILSESSTCIPKHCKSHKNSECLSCKQGYKNNNKKCEVQNCLKVNKNQQCISCNTGYQLDNKTGLCSKIRLRYCLEEVNVSCKRCQYGFSITNQGYCGRSNCLKDSLLKCQKCQDGYFINNQNNGICEPVNCKKVQVNNLCETCLQGYYMSESKICKPQKCKKFNQDYKCQQCKKGYSSTLKGLCQLNQAQLTCPKLSFYNSSSKKCQKLSVPNCKTAINVQISNTNNIEQCIECFDGYYLSDGNCYLMEGCNMANAEEGCWSCQKGWVLRDRLCFRDSCSAWMSGICQVCHQGYVITADRKSCVMKVYNCEKQDKYGRCVKCPQGFEPMQDYKGCVAKNCKKIDPASQTCQQCQNPYILTPSNTCILPPTPNIPNCLYFSQNQCRKCNQGYSNFKNKCLKYQQGCQIRDHDGICLFCKYGFALLHHRCRSDHSNCVLKEDNGYGCRFCKKGFHVRVDGVCYQNQQFCQVEGLRGVCEKCVDQYELDQHNNCVLKAQEKQSSPQQKQSKNLQEQPEAQYPSSNVQEPIQRYMQNCLIKDDIHQACIMCESDYYTTEQGYCQLIPQNCQFIDMHGVCFQCDPGYHLIGNKCIKETESGKKNNNKTGKINEIMGNNQGNLRSGKF